MASLPSFVELMASLGLEQSSAAPAVERSPSPTPISTPGSPCSTENHLELPPMRSSSSPSLSLKEATKHRVSRYSPYSAAVSFTKRRDSLSSVSSSSDFESSPLSATFFLPNRPTTSRPRRYRNKPSVHAYGSSSDLAADTPISTYVRRKTPGTSPTSPTFSRDSGYESSSPEQMPFTIPTLPVLFPHSASSESFPYTPSSDLDMSDSRSSSPTIAVKSLSDIIDGTDYYRFVRSRRIGTRISAPSRPKEHPRRK
ncbi:hypothetical protein BDN70DRAFT_928790 [Pholiota conissans]|uniref:Uncharacterized protein n=1 Tax=Pholiota conissans TaxID=109636 RepID=A0A9P6D5U6_9AGAR|nr:hypothetical protein BDN70DRAFT_928790 [Pholiota conissans]